VADPAKLLYSKNHEWAEIEGDVARVGITDYAQNALGDIVYVELPRAGATVEQFGNVGVVESVKAVSDLFTPVGGEVLEANGGLENDPALVNQQPYDAGWMVRVRMCDPSEKNNLLSFADYEKLVSEEAH